jgi:tRNA-dihydrouridine synthase
MLCRKYGVDLAYTPMMNSERFAVDASYREVEFQTNQLDRPLVAHFSGNNPEILLTAARATSARICWEMKIASWC